MDDAYLPDDDLDLALARGLDGGGASSDPLAARLAVLRTSAPVPEARSAALWARIEAETRPAVRRVDRPAEAPVRVRRVRWTFVGAVATLAGLATVVLATLRPWQTLTAERFAVLPGAAVDTVRLSDASRVVLRPGATLERVAHTRDRVRYRLDGEAFFDVTHDPARTFEVEAGGAVVAVLGTAFRVSTAGDSTVVTLERGRVALTGRSGDRVVLAPGQEAVARPQGVSRPVAADAEAALDWMDGRLTFRQTTAAAVSAELARHYGVEVVLPANVEGETVSGSLVLGPRAETLDALGRVLGGRFEDHGTGVYRFTR